MFHDVRMMGKHNKLSFLATEQMFSQVFSVVKRVVKRASIQWRVA